MRTIIMDMKNGIDAEQLRSAGDIIKNGGLVAFPTETVYGLGGDALNAGSSKKIYEAKGRPSDNPLIVHIADMEALPPLAAAVPPAALRLAEQFWPGPLTMIFKGSGLVPRETTGGLDTVAVRMPSHPVAAALIRAGGGYVAAPSANRTGRPSPTTAAHVIEDLSGRIDAVIDGGNADIGLESTIFDLSDTVPAVLRPGYIGLDRLRETIGDVRMDPGLISDDSSVRPKAPGMKYRHYAPKALMTVMEGPPGDVVRAINEKAARQESMGRKVGVICSQETAGAYTHGIVRCVGSLADEKTIAMHLYGVLREFDTLGVDEIYSEAFDTPMLGAAIMNRLLKAAGHRVEVVRR